MNSHADIYDNYDDVDLKRAPQPTLRIATSSMLRSCVFPVARSHDGMFYRCRLQRAIIQPTGRIRYAIQLQGRRNQPSLVADILYGRPSVSANGSSAVGLIIKYNMHIQLEFYVDIQHSGVL